MCNAEALLDRVSVGGGEGGQSHFRGGCVNLRSKHCPRRENWTSPAMAGFALPDGVSYRLLVLPDRKVMPAEVLQKIRQLVEAGATVVGPKPEKAPGLAEYPDCDEAVRRLADELWGELDGKTATEREGGGGTNCLGQAVAGNPAGRGRATRLRARGTRARHVHRLHPPLRRCGGNLLAGEPAEPGRSRFGARSARPAGGRRLAPASGETRLAAAFRQAAGRTTVPLKFGPHGSLFVVFREPIAADASGPAAANFPR